MVFHARTETAMASASDTTIASFAKKVVRLWSTASIMPGQRSALRPGVQKTPEYAVKTWVSVQFPVRKVIVCIALIAAALSTGIGGTNLPAASAQETPPAKSSVSEVAVFYYPWYATPEHDGHWSHWEQSGKAPEHADIGANFFPINGVYSSADAGVIESHMQQIAAAGIDTVVSSWWGKGSYEDEVLDKILAAAKPLHLKVAAHIEPYKGRGDASLRADHDYLYDRGIRDFYIYQTQSLSTSGIRAAQDIAGDDRFFGEAANQAAVRNGSFMHWSREANFDGIYTYDPRGFSGSDFPAICEMARAQELLCMPSVGPGWDGTRATKIPGVLNRRDGATYDASWQGAIDAKADIVTITSFNEWHEGTQIEPAGPRCLEKYCYTDYDGAYGKHGTQAAYAYLDRTLHWSTTAKGRAPLLSQRLSVVSSALRRNDAPALDRFRSLKVQVVS
jgi:glycoprotein endo-alpha-1,2-mannosidase